MYIYAFVASLYLVSSLATPTWITPKLPIAQHEQQSWAQYSPYFPTAQYKAPPHGCVVTQVSSSMHLPSDVHLCVSCRR